MKKLVRGIVEFQKKILPSYRETFAKLALGQSPDTLFIACSDSRVVPNLFASTDPGDLFVVRNVGNLVPPCSGSNGQSMSDESEGAAIEFAINQLNITDVIICGHSECGAMQSLINGRDSIGTPNLKGWLRHGELALNTIKEKGQGCNDHNVLSKENVLQQIENLKTYPIVQERLKSNRLRIHGWWFELAGASVHCYDPDLKCFTEITEAKAEEILKNMI